MAAAPILIAACDLDGRITLSEGRSLEALGVRPGEHVGQLVWDLYPENTAGLDALRRAIAGEEVAGEFEVRGLWFELFARPLLAPGGERQGAVWVATNVTERVRAERERERLSSELARSQRLESVGRLAGGVAHDFNNLLAVILNYAGFALQDLAPGPTREDVEEIRRAAERASTLVRQLLLFSRREAASPRVLDLNELVRDLERLLRRTLGEQVELRTRLDPGLHPVKVDAGQIEQAIVNLVVNARDALGSGGWVELATANTPASPPRRSTGAWVALTVRDNGHGMDPDVLAQAFDPYFTTKGAHTHSGLGLPTVYGVVEEAGGHVELDSTPGRGTAVLVFLPATREPRTPPPPPPPPVQRGRGETVLLVEDDVGVLELTRRLLSDGGYTVLAAESAPQALTLAARHAGTIDVLLTDVVMPGVSGHELAQRIRIEQPGVAVLYMTGHADDALMGEELADAPLLRKPFDRATLLAAVRAGVRRGRAAQPE